MNFFLISAIILYLGVIFFLLIRYLAYTLGKINISEKPCLYLYIGPLIDKVVAKSSLFIKNILHYFFLFVLLAIRYLLFVFKYLITRAESFFSSIIERFRRKIEN